MRRIAFAGVALLVVAVAAAVVVPGRGNKQDARLILIAAAQAAEKARTVHMSGRADAGGELAPGRMDMWFGPRAMYMRYTWTDGKVLLASCVSADSNRWWFYDDRVKTRYVADLKPIAARAADAVMRFAQFGLSDQLNQVLTESFSGAKQSVATETRDGRKLAVLTFAREIRPPSRREQVTDRWVFDVDDATRHLVAWRRYWGGEGERERMITEFDRIEYDLPLPEAEAARWVPDEARTQEAQVVDDGERLVLEANGVKLNPGSAFTTLNVRLQK